MLDTILGFKQKMGAVYIKDRRFTVTWVKVDPCVVTQVKHPEKDGYMAVQLGAGSRSNKNLTKPLQNHLKSVIKDKKSPKYLREIRTKEGSDLKVGDEVRLTDVLKKGDMVTLTGISKGKGFAGVVKRWGFHGGPKTHGQSDRERAPGSIGQRTTPGRVYKGKKMAGRMGSDRVTVESLVVLDIDEKNSLVAITGAVPGATGGLVFIKKTGESRLKTQLDEAQVKQEDKVEEAEPSSAPDVAEAMTGKQVEQVEKDKGQETKPASVQGSSGGAKVEVKKVGNEESKKPETKESETEKKEDKEAVQEVKTDSPVKSEKKNTGVTD